MTALIPNIRKRICEFDFSGLFIEELGWDRFGTSQRADVDGVVYELMPIAEKRGFQVFRCLPNPDGTLPDRVLRQKIDGQVAKQAMEHLIVYTDRDDTLQQWQWALREPERPVAYRENHFQAGDSGQRLAEKLQHLFVSIDDEERLTLVDVSQRVSLALRKDRVTKKFYERFDKERKALLPKIEGIADSDIRDWYASIMLNRLMFVYFIQKKNFLNNDPNYLRNKLEAVQRTQGRDQFYDYYREFLLKLFHDGLATKKPRPAEIERLLGDVPYLNGGIFEQHQIEQTNPDIRIPDQAFEQIFAFFDSYDWHLDDRALRDDTQINPDVLGYIFEKYINQKQMGAYYTKEDITEYISKNTIIPFLFDAAKQDCAIAFRPDGALWGLLQDNPDRYIYDAVRKGVAIPLPPEIEAGRNAVAQRGGWNRPAADDYALPTETWREHVARRTRYEEIWNKLLDGEVTSIDDLITYNLDIRQFAQDVIQHAEGPELVRAFFKAIREVSVLDPTCGSGAFLFAALNILHPLYDACLERMEEFVDALERNPEPQHPNRYSDFKAVLAEMGQHTNRDYAIFKTIIARNLYGVDIMEEAVEICKLRLFLKLASKLEPGQPIEPLPDIDFNIRAGNTLVGFTSMADVRRAALMDSRGVMRLPLPDDLAAINRIEEQAAIADRIFQQFREQQTKIGGTITAANKAELRNRLRTLSDELDRYLARFYKIFQEKDQPSLDYQQRFSAWRESHQPFHWLIDFYGIMQRGGFDVIIGNPPYVSTRKVEYLQPSNETSKFSDIYAHILVRCLAITAPTGRSGMIVPLSVTFSEDFGYLRSALCSWGSAWFSSYDNIPAALFSGVSQRCTIWLGTPIGKSLRVTPMHRWRSTYRSYLLESIFYLTTEVPLVEAFGIPKIASDAQERILRQHRALAKPGPRFIPRDPLAEYRLGFAPAARNFMSSYVDAPPCLDADTLDRVLADQPSVLRLRNRDAQLAALAVVLGEASFWYWLARGDGFHVTSGLLSDFVAAENAIPENHLSVLARLGQHLHQRRFEGLVFKKNAGKYVGNFNYRTMPELTRRADLVLLAGLGLGRRDAEEVFDYVQRVLAINEQAGEKAIPAEVKAMFPPLPIDEAEQQSVFRAADDLIRTHYGFTDEELDFIINYDIKYRMGRDGLADDAADTGGDEGE